MATATVTSKGQITIPAQVRAKLGMKAGDRVEFVESHDGQFAIMLANQSIKSMKGMVIARHEGAPDNGVVMMTTLHQVES